MAMGERWDIVARRKGKGVKGSRGWVALMGDC
jgi:hypothetical protein